MGAVVMAAGVPTAPQARGAGATADLPEAAGALNHSRRTTRPVTIRARIRIALSQVHEARHSGTAPGVVQPLAAARSSIAGRYPFWRGRLLECVGEGHSDLPRSA